MKEILQPTLQYTFRGCARSRSDEGGQALLEFALIVPFLFLMLIGVVFITQGMNLQIVVSGAAYEGARIWAKNPPRGDYDHCTPPACDPIADGARNFEKYVMPAVRQYISNHGFDGEKAYFYTDNPEKFQEILQLYSGYSQFIKVIVLYPIDLPIGSFAGGYQRVLVVGTCTFRRGA